MTRRQILSLLCLTALWTGDAYAQRIQQPLGRGVVAVQNGSSVTVTWRRLAQEPETATYNLYVDGQKANAEPLANTNFVTHTSVVPIGSQVSVTMVADGQESAPSVPFTMESRDCRGMFMSILFDQSPLEASAFSTSYVWPADLDGDGEMDYVVNRKNTSDALDNYVEGYLRTGEHLWTVKLGPNELSCSGQDDMILAYDMDGDGKSEVVVQTSDGTQFWDPQARTFGSYVNGSATGDTDLDGIMIRLSVSVSPIFFPASSLSRISLWHSRGKSPYPGLNRGRRYRPLASYSSRHLRFRLSQYSSITAAAMAWNTTARLTRKRSYL